MKCHLFRVTIGALGFFTILCFGLIYFCLDETDIWSVQDLMINLTTNDPGAPLKVEILSIDEDKKTNSQRNDTHQVTFLVTNLSPKRIFVRCPDAQLSDGFVCGTFMNPNLVLKINYQLITVSGTTSWDDNMLDPGRIGLFALPIVNLGRIPRSSSHIQYLFILPYTYDHGTMGLMPPNLSLKEAKSREFDVKTWYMEHPDGTFRFHGTLELKVEQR